MKAIPNKATGVPTVRQSFAYSLYWAAIVLFPVTTGLCSGPAVQLSLGVVRCRSNQRGLGLQLAQRAVQLPMGVD